MSNKIVKDSGLPIFVKEVVALAAGGNLANLPKANDVIAVGAVVGLVGAEPRLGEDGAYYTTVDTAALVRISGVAGAVADKAPVYLSGGAVSGTAGGTAIGYADRAKATGTGDLWVQLVPRTGA